MGCANYQDMKRTPRKVEKPEALEARYANYFEVGHNAYEFILDFGQYQPDTTKIQAQTRVVTGPVFAKILSNMLSQAILQFEEEHGPIDSNQSDLDPLELVRQSLKGFDRKPTLTNGRSTRRK